MDYKILVKKLRISLMLTQKEFASMLGVSFETVNRYENGKSVPTMRIKRKIKKLIIDAGLEEEELCK